MADKAADSLESAAKTEDRKSLEIPGPDCHYNLRALSKKQLADLTRIVEGHRDETD